MIRIMQKLKDIVADTNDEYFMQAGFKFSNLTI